MGIKKKIMKIKKDSVTGLEGKTIVLEQSKEWFGRVKISFISKTCICETVKTSPSYLRDIFVTYLTMLKFIGKYDILSYSSFFVFAHNMCANAVRFK